MTMLYPNLCYNNVCYKETVLYRNKLEICTFLYMSADLFCGTVFYGFYFFCDLDLSKKLI